MPVRDMTKCHIFARNGDFDQAFLSLIQRISRFCSNSITFSHDNSVAGIPDIVLRMPYLRTMAGNGGASYYNQKGFQTTASQPNISIGSFEGRLTLGFNVVGDPRSVSA